MTVSPSRLAVPALLLATTPALAQTRSPFGMGAPAPAEPVTSGIVAWLLQQQAAFHKALTTAISAVSADPSAMFALIGLAFAYGVLHAIGPGHGKAVITSYLVASERAMRRGVALAFGAAAVQALIALGVVLIVAGLMRGTAATMNTTVSWVEKFGFTLVAAMGLWIVFRRLRAIFAGTPDACLDPACDHDHGGDPAMLAKADWRGMTLAAIGAGIRPCSGAIILLVFALAKGLLLAGVLSVTAMAVGTAIGTSLFALLAVKAKLVALNLVSGRGSGWRYATIALEIVAGLALAAIGISLLMAGGGGN